jgi:hypothetical protein
MWNRLGLTQAFDLENIILKCIHRSSKSILHQNENRQFITFIADTLSTVASAMLGRFSIASGSAVTKLSSSNFLFLICMLPF